MLVDKDFKDGYEAGLNAWPYDLSKINNEKYNKGWSLGWAKRQSQEKTNE